MLFKEVQVPLPSTPILWCANVSALALASNPVFHARTKHIKVDYHFVREKVLNREILVKFISTVDQVADIFTNACFAHLTSKLMVIPPISSWGVVRITDMAKDNSKPLSKCSYSYHITINLFSCNLSLACILSLATLPPTRNFRCNQILLVWCTYIYFLMHIKN